MMSRSHAQALRFPAKDRLRILRGYVAGLVVVGIGLLVSVVGVSIVPTAAFGIVFPLGVLIVTARYGIGPAVLTAVGGVLVFDYVFVPPFLAFALPDLKNGVTLGVMVAVAAVASVLAEQLRRHAERSDHQAKVERIRNALLSALSHDLRTPLTVLVGASSALCDHELEPRQQHELAQMIAEEARRLNRLVANLLELTRLEAGGVRVKQVPQAIDDVIGSALRRADPLLRGWQVSTHVPEEIPFAAFDPVLIEQVLINLIENAVSHAANGLGLEIAARRSGSEIVVEVLDRGSGVPRGEEEKVFEKLYRARKDRGGAGLGLTICRAIVTAHGGRIWLENRPGGGGAIVRFTLPVDASAPDLLPLAGEAGVPASASP
jgi:two-component system sensor histidine kinase KdpD